MSVPGERVTVHPAHLEGCENADIWTTMTVWITRMGPVTHNQWQSFYFVLIRENGYTDEESSAGESASDRQARLRGKWVSIQSEVHGPDHAAKAVLANRVGKTLEQI